MSISAAMADEWIDVDCPACGFSLEIQIMDVLCQVYRRCPCCRSRIHLVEAGGEMHGALASVDSAFDDLERNLNRLFR